MSHTILPLPCSQCAVFLLNSPSHLFAAAGPCSGRAVLHTGQHTFSLSYGIILPSSFTRVLSSALVCSTRPPVSVSGTAAINLKLRSFSRKHGINVFPRRGAVLSGLILQLAFIRASRNYTLSPAVPKAGTPGLLRPSFAINVSTGILTGFPSASLFSLSLGTDSPCPD